MIYYTGSPALYRKSRLHRKSHLIQEVPPPIPEVPPTPEVPPPIPEVPPTPEAPPPIPEAPPTCQSIILTGGVWYLLLT